MYSFGEFERRLGLRFSCGSSDVLKLLDDLVRIVWILVNLFDLIKRLSVVSNLEFQPQRVLMFQHQEKDFHPVFWHIIFRRLSFYRNIGLLKFLWFLWFIFLMMLKHISDDRFLIILRKFNTLNFKCWLLEVAKRLWSSGQLTLIGSTSLQELNFTLLGIDSTNSFLLFNL